MKYFVSFVYTQVILGSVSASQGCIQYSNKFEKEFGNIVISYEEILSNKTVHKLQEKIEKGLEHCQEGSLVVLNYKVI